MAGVSDKGLIGAGPWPLGMDNQSKEGALPADENGNLVALRDALNVDIDAQGFVRRREGFDLAVAGSLCHSGWSNELVPFGLYVDDGELIAIFEDASTENLGFTVGNQPLSYALINDRVFFTNPVVSGIVTMDLQVHAWGPADPAGQPDAAAVSGFGLDPGQYQVAVTFTDLLGRESGSTLAVVVNVAAGQGIELTNIPLPADMVATPTVNLYVTDANDQVLRLYTSIPAGMRTLVITQQAQRRTLRTQFLTTMPAGSIVAELNGIQYVAVGNLLRWSPTMRYGLTNFQKNVIHFADGIDMLMPVGAGGGGAGLFVGSGKRVIWLGGTDPTKFNRKIASGAGVVAGSGIYVRGEVLGMDNVEDVPVWLSKKGYWCVGREGGGITAIKAAALIDDATSAAAMFREVDGIQQLVATIKGGRGQGLAVVDRAVATYTPAA